MARYTGPKTKIARKFGEPIFGDDKSFEKRNYPPGQHGNNKRRSKKSEYAVQLMEKQKAKYTYGILERQFRNLFKKATASKGITGEVLLQLCESRLDNVVFRMGLSNSRRGARQLVSHRHITVNGEIVNIPSYNLKAGDVIAVREKSKSIESIENCLKNSSSVYEWITWNDETMQGTYVSVPERIQIPENINEPGQHGNNKRRSKKSEYAVQLMEKQKAKYTYGILERQFRNLFKKATASKGITGEVLLQLCESRLDNVVFRMGLSNSRRGARQLVSHRHITVNGEIVNIPSYNLKAGDVIAVREKSKSIESIENCLKNSSSVYEWITWNDETMQGIYVSVPERIQIPENINEQYIVELYSK